MRLSIIGGGRVGQTLGRLAAQAGYEIGEVVCRSRRRAQSAVRFIGAGAAQEARRSRLARSDIFLISTPDDRIADAAEMIERSDAALSRSVALHTSGALASDVLARLASRGMSVGSCHPLQTFESPSRALKLVPETYFCIEGQPLAARAARRLVRSIGARHFEIATEQKPLYHAAAVLASAGTIALLSRSLEMLVRCGLSQAESKRVLLPLVEGTLANVRATATARALTGPVRRGDAGTVRRNIEAVAEFDADWLKVYLLLARQALRLAERAGGDREKLSELRRLLEEEMP